MGLSQLPIVAEHGPTHDDCGFTIKFDRPYDIRTEDLPLTSDAASRAVDQAYQWGYDPAEMNDGEQVGIVQVSNRTFVRAWCTK